MNTLEIFNLSKKIKGISVLSNINLSLSGGTIYGFIGENGSGKTMLFRAICGLIHPTDGKIVYNEQTLHKDIETLPSVGLLIENAGLYPDLSGFENLALLANINNKISKQQIHETILRVGLNPNDAKPFKKYSLGMKQRIVLAQALMEQPDVILLDEPTNALDQNGIELIRQIILEEKKRGAIILIASHNKDDISLLADKTYTIKEGILGQEEICE